jgi:hypothetical protein
VRSSARVTGKSRLHRPLFFFSFSNRNEMVNISDRRTVRSGTDWCSSSIAALIGWEIGEHRVAWLGH